ncbi:MAG: glycosyltransferase family 1 protein [Candidatus Buchananbacteria bacterium]
MLKIGIDASRANKDQKTGTEWYSYYVIEELKKLLQNSDKKVLLYTNEPLKSNLGKMPNSNWQEKILNWPPKYLWTQIRLWWELFKNPPDVLFVPAHTIPFLPIPKKTKVLVNVHDVGFKRFPKLYKPIQVWYHDFTMKKIKSRADVIITISEFSKREIMELYQVNAEKIKVVYLSFDKEKYNEQTREIPKDEVLAKFKITKPFLLFLGRIEIKKNILNMAKAFALTKENNPDLQLVFAGSTGNGYEELQSLVKDLKIEDDVIFTGYVTEKEAQVLNANASIFLFTTLYEGFGIPILQSMACGTPVLISDLDVHNEIAGGVAIPADPYNSEKMAEKINQMLNDENLRQELIQKGLARVKDFSWERTAQEILKIIFN